MTYPGKLHGIRTAVLFLLIFAWFEPALAQMDAAPETDPGYSPGTDTAPPIEPIEEDRQLSIGAASVCEAVKNGIPRNEAIVFSTTLGRVYCFTDFLNVPERSFIYHHWFFEDQKRASVKLLLRPPRWSTYSSLQLRATDVGPWRVDVTTEDGSVLRTLRFSILE